MAIPQIDAGSFATPPHDSQYNLRTVWEKEMGQTSTPVKHDKTSVLMLSWHQDYDDLGVAKEVDTLAETLETGYRFHVSKKSLHTKRSPQIQAFRHLSEFVDEHDDRRSLLIIYYAGHGWTEADSSKKINFKLSGKMTTDEDEIRNHSINWMEVERVLVKTKADVFVIFDCCYAGALCKPAFRDGPTSRAFQYLGACTADERTRAPGEESFTTAITWAFQQLQDQQGFSVNHLAHLVQKAPKFPEDQHPQLYDGRFELSLEYMYIAPMPVPGTGAQGQYRDEVARQRKAYELLDLRFFFERPISEQALKTIARELRSRCHHKAETPWLKVSLIRKSTVAEWSFLKWKEVARERARARSQPDTPLISTPVLPPRSEALLGSHSRSDGSLKLPHLRIPDLSVSDDDTISPSPRSEGTPLLPKHPTNGKSPGMARSRIEDDVLYHLKRAGLTFFAKTTNGLAWSLKAIFPCYPAKRKGADSLWPDDFIR